MFFYPFLLKIIKHVKLKVIYHYYMRQILDLHIHSKYSRACSRDLVLQKIDQTCRVKGVDIIATGDFTHPVWFAGIKSELEPLLTSPFAKEREKSGLYKLKSAEDDRIKFILSTEVALIYKARDKTRRLHIVIHAPNIEAAEELNQYLEKSGYNIKSDGRPILGMQAPQLVKTCMSINPKFLVYPAHIWTPWFSVFGSKSGFDQMEECFEDQTENIYAIETGLSSDPAMNWRLSALDKLTVISNSDAHSLTNIAREANIMELEHPGYDEIYDAIKNKDPNKIKGTLEFYPEEGMYHFDGHRACGIRFEPRESKKHKRICPVCKKPLTIGVASRVEELADREEGYESVKAAPFRKLVELDKIIADALGIKSRHSKRVLSEYHKMIKALGSELEIILDVDIDKITDVAYPEIAEGVRRVREGKLIIEPGFDGQYGTIKIFEGNERIQKKQQALF